MIVSKLNEPHGTDREANADNWNSRRLLLKDDQMGFSPHDTTIRAGTSIEIHYQNQLEAVYCIAGKGSVNLLDSGEVFVIEEGTVYPLDKNDRHILMAETEMRIVCVFNPPLVDPESHEANGVYPILADA